MKKTTLFKLMLLLVLVVWSLNASASSDVNGDLNNDGRFNISDVTYLINNLLEGDTDWTQDVNADGKVSISDVCDLIQVLLDGGLQWPYNTPTGFAPANAVTYYVNGYPLVMVPVEGGTFTMGSQNTDENAPVFEVKLSSFSIGMTEVTMGLWKAVTGSYPWGFVEGLDDDNSPVYYCSWDKAKEFITQLNEVTGLNFRLPSEAQWEFAARGGNLSHGYKYAGSDNCVEVGWCVQSDVDRLQTVGQLKPNELGLYDMSGNLLEFCEDDFNGAYLDFPNFPLVDPVRVSNYPEVSFRSLRGGSNSTFDIWCTVSARRNYYILHGEEAWDVGFRLVL